MIGSLWRVFEQRLDEEYLSSMNSYRTKLRNNLGHVVHTYMLKLRKYGTVDRCLGSERQATHCAH